MRREYLGGEHVFFLDSDDDLGNLLRRKLLRKTSGVTLSRKDGERILEELDRLRSLVSGWERSAPGEEVEPVPCITELHCWECGDGVDVEMVPDAARGVFLLKMPEGWSVTTYHDMSVADAARERNSPLCPNCTTYQEEEG